MTEKIEPTDEFPRIQDERGDWWRWNPETGFWQAWYVGTPEPKWIDAIGPNPRASRNLARLVEIAALGVEGGEFLPERGEWARWTGTRWERRDEAGQWVESSLVGSPKHYAALLALLPPETPQPAASVEAPEPIKITPQGLSMHGLIGKTVKGGFSAEVKKEPEEK